MKQYDNATLIHGIWKSKNMTQNQWMASCSRSSLRRFSVKQVFLKTSQNSQENTCARVFQSLRLATLLKKRLWHRCLSLRFTKFLKILFFTEHLWWLLLLFCKRKTWQTFLVIQQLHIRSCIFPISDWKIDRLLSPFVYYKIKIPLRPKHTLIKCMVL